jgi:hypothetical protein
MKTLKLAFILIESHHSRPDGGVQLGVESAVADVRITG